MQNAQEPKVEEDNPLAYIDINMDQRTKTKSIKGA
jgi:hypothetical protein